MLQYENHRFCWGEVAIEIPEGFFWNPDPDFELQTGIFLLSPDKAYSLDILIYEDAVSAYEELTDIVMDFTLLEPVTAITVNTFSGYQAVYRTRTEQHYVVKLNIPGGVLSVEVKTDGQNIGRIKDRLVLGRIVHHR